jgi:hypothetical protein
VPVLVVTALIEVDTGLVENDRARLFSGYPVGSNTLPDIVMGIGFTVRETFIGGIVILALLHTNEGVVKATRASPGTLIERDIVVA